MQFSTEKEILSVEKLCKEGAPLVLAEHKMMMLGRSAPGIGRIFVPTVRRSK